MKWNLLAKSMFDFETKYFILFFSVICSFIILFRYWINDFHSAGVIFCMIVLFFAAFLPMIGCLRMALSFQKAGTYYMPMEEWDIYRYIKKKTLPRSTVLAFSFSNLQLLPVYTHSNLYVRGAEWLESPEQELKKYIKSLKFVGDNCKCFLKGFDDYFSNKFSCSPNIIKNENLFKKFHLINTLIYFPYVKRINTIELADQDGKSWSVGFTQYLNILIDNSVGDIPVNEIDYILIDKEDFPFIKNDIQPFKEIYSNEKYALFNKQCIPW